jgi:hypothetical protein
MQEFFHGTVICARNSGIKRKQGEWRSVGKFLPNRVGAPQRRGRVFFDSDCFLVERFTYRVCDVTPLVDGNP